MPMARAISFVFGERCLRHGGLGQLAKAHHGLGLRFAKRAQLGVDVLDQGGDQRCSGGKSDGFEQNGQLAPVNTGSTAINHVASIGWRQGLTGSSAVRICWTTPAGALRRRAGFLLHRQNLRWMHGEAAQSQSQQQPGEGGVTRHFATHADALALRSALCDGFATRRNTAGCMGSGGGRGGPRTHRLGQWPGVLDEVVGAN